MGTQSTFPKAWAAISAMLLLAACQTSSGNVFSDAAPKGNDAQPVQVAPGTNPNAVGRLKNTQNALSTYCPSLQIRAGTETLRKYAKGADKDNPDNVQYQAQITKIARECTYVGQNLEITIGARGRIVSGPAVKSGSVTMPIRIAIQEGACSRHFELHQQPSVISTDSAHAFFQFVDEKVIIPAPKARNVIMYIGFDEGPYNKTSSKKCA